MGSVIALTGAEPARHRFQTGADLFPDLTSNTLTVRLHHLIHAANDRAIQHLLDEFNDTQTIFPGTSLTLVFKLGSDYFHKDREV